MLHLMPELEKAPSGPVPEQTDDLPQAPKGLRKQIRDDVAVVVRGEYQALHLLLEEGLKHMQQVQREAFIQQVDVIKQAIALNHKQLQMGAGFDAFFVPKPTTPEKPAVAHAESFPSHEHALPVARDVEQIGPKNVSQAHGGPQVHPAPVAPPGGERGSVSKEVFEQTAPTEGHDEKTPTQAVAKANAGIQALAGASGWNKGKQDDDIEGGKLHRLQSTVVDGGSAFGCSPIRRKLVQVVSHPYFDAFSGALIVLNSIFMGVKTQVLLSEAQHGDADSKGGFKAIEYFFTFVFLVEWVIRLGAFQRLFFSTKERGWHAFDTLLILAGMIEIVMGAVSGGEPPGGETLILRVLRIVRLMRLLRIMRFVGAFRELRLLVSGLLGSTRALLWSLVLLSLVLYIFGIFFGQGVLTFITSGDDIPEQVRADLLMYFGSIEATMVTMFAVISGGTDWLNVMEKLAEINSFYTLAFIVYIMVTYHGLLHVIVGIFVDSTMTASRNDRDLVIADELSRKDSYMAQMSEVLKETDTDGSGTISWEEFEGQLQDERVKAYFAALELDMAEAQGLFELLDTEETDEVPIDEFVLGCFRLKGGAKGIDLAALMYENKKMMKTFKHFMDHNEERLVQLDRRLVQLDATLSQPKALS